MSKEINVKSAADIVVSQYGTNARFNYGTKYAVVTYSYFGNKLRFTVCYYDTEYDNKPLPCACQAASICGTAKGVIQKVKQFFNIK